MGYNTIPFQYVLRKYSHYCALHMETQYKIKDVLKSTKAKLKRASIPSYQLDSEVLVAHVLDMERLNLILHAEKIFPLELMIKLQKYIALRLARMPISHILQKREFFHRDFIVNHSVIAPRPETELLVELALKYHHIIDARKNSRQDVKVLDLGTGSGCIILSLLCALPALKNATATDISEDAIRVAKLNAKRLQVCEKRLYFIQSNWLNFAYKYDIDDNRKCVQQYDIVTCNPPYVPYSQWLHLMPEVKQYEPLHAISDCDDGLLHYRTIMSQLRDVLTEDGVAIFEFGYGQKDELQQIAKKNSFVISEVISDIAGIERAMVITKNNIA